MFDFVVRQCGESQYFSTTLAVAMAKLVQWLSDLMAFGRQSNLDTHELQLPK